MYLCVRMPRAEQAVRQSPARAGHAHRRSVWVAGRSAAVPPQPHIHARHTHTSACEAAQAAGWPPARACRRRPLSRCTWRGGLRRCRRVCIYIYIYSRAAHVPMHARARGGAGGHLGAGLSRVHPLKLSVCVGVECGGAASRPLPCIYICMIGSGAELAAVTAGRWRGGKGGGAKCRGDTMAMLIHTVSRQIRICMSGSGAVLAAS